MRLGTLKVGALAFGFRIPMRGYELNDPWNALYGYPVPNPHEGL